MRVVPFNSTEIFGISDKDYGEKFTVEQLEAFVFQYKEDLKLLEARKIEVIAYYRGKIKHLPNLYYANVTSMTDIEELADLIDRKIVRTEDSLDRWELILERRLK